MEKEKNYKKRYRIFLVLFIILAILFATLVSFFVITEAYGIIESAKAFASPAADPSTQSWGYLTIKVPENMAISCDMLDFEQPQEMKDEGYDWFTNINSYSIGKLKQYMKYNNYVIAPGVYFVEVNASLDRLRDGLSLVDAGSGGIDIDGYIEEGAFSDSSDRDSELSLGDFNDLLESLNE